ncbi:coiled-coil domain-containing protein 9B isoform X3 [Rana temporaria]|uniref:coiled-coil domain-containing protein 9B isoform X3 n=1 Tax=Rana temporaria TaxID=8407 RepID=UPI001AAC615E|nr:coiled-coil domain-containing protein 9B isoform X3 [Rana temporaria]
MEDGQQMVSLSDGEIRKKELKDAEFEKKIKALKKKNEALVRRYEEIEEDKRNAEKHGKAITSRRAKQDNLTITITKAPNEKRVVSENWNNSDSEEEQRLTVQVGREVQLAVTVDSKVEGKKLVNKKNEQDCILVTNKASNWTMEEVDHLFSFGRGRRMQIAIAMEQGKSVASKKNDQDCYLGISNVPKLTMEEVDHLFSYGRGHRREIAISMEQEAKKKTGKKREEIEKIVVKEQSSKVSLKDHFEYLKWKKEREQIDLDRVARHKNSKGEWRRPWDVEKTDDMFKDDSDTVPSGFCGKRGLKMTLSTLKQLKMDSVAKEVSVT